MPEVDTVTADKYACAFATKECPGILRKHPLGEDYLCDAPNYCPPCSGIGRVRVLTGVTEPCPQLSDYPHFHFCPVCHGLDEVPTDDLEKWLEAIALRGWRVLFEEDGVSFYREESLPHVWQQGFGRPFHALLSALKQALVADGAELGAIQ